MNGCHFADRFYSCSRNSWQPLCYIVFLGYCLQSDVLECKLKFKNKRIFESEIDVKVDNNRKQLLYVWKLSDKIKNYVDVLITLDVVNYTNTTNLQTGN